MRTIRRDDRAPGGFTLLELLIVIVIIVLVSAATLPVVLPALAHRQVSEGARLLQATLAGARDSAIRANAPRGVRLLPDPSFPGPGVLAANRMIAIEPAADYDSGRIDIVAGDYPTLANNYQLSVTESVASNGIVNEPTSWYWNIRQGDKIRFDDSGRYYTIAGPMQVKRFVASGLNNNERYVNYGPPGSGFNPLGGSLAPDSNYNPSPFSGPANHFPEILHLVNGQDDDGDGWVDESFDGIDNDGDGIIDPGYNGLDDDGDNVVDNPAELLINKGGEYEPETFLGSQFAPGQPQSFLGQRYTIIRRPVVAEGAREVALPQGVVIDLTTWNAGSAFLGNNAAPSLPERSRLPVDPYSLSVDILIAPNGQVVPSGPGAASISAGGIVSSPTSNMPFYHFWVTEREDVLDPLWGIGPPTGTINPSVPVANPAYNSNPPLRYLLPMPKGTTNAAGTVAYTPPAGSNGSYLKGDRRLVTLFVRTGLIVTNEIETFDPTDTNVPFYQAQFGTREAK